MNSATGIDLVGTLATGANPPEAVAADADPVDGFAAALRPDGWDGHWLVHAAGDRSRLPVRRWHGPAEPAMIAVVARCVGPTLDLGCGPGRLTLALARAGLTAVGVDISGHAVRLTLARGAVAIHGDLFAPLPGEGRWAHVALADGNIGIGGDPVALLRRCRTLLAPRGAVLVELEPPGTGLWQGLVHVSSPQGNGGVHLGPPFRWARLDVRAVNGAAAAAGLTVREVFRSGRRWFGELTVP
jgi:SAM-dependent methyltransferase